MRFLLGFLLLPMFPGMGVSFGQGLGGHVISGFVREEGSSMPLEAAKLEMLSLERDLPRRLHGFINDLKQRGVV